MRRMYVDEPNGNVRIARIIHLEYKDIVFHNTLPPYVVMPKRFCQSCQAKDLVFFAIDDNGEVPYNLANFEETRYQRVNWKFRDVVVDNTYVNFQDIINNDVVINNIIGMLTQELQEKIKNLESEVSHLNRRVEFERETSEKQLKHASYNPKYAKDRYYLLEWMHKTPNDIY